MKMEVEKKALFVATVGGFVAQFEMNNVARSEERRVGKEGSALCR